jgi:hypothetical protein
MGWLSDTSRDPCPSKRSIYIRKTMGERGAKPSVRRLVLHALLFFFHVVSACRAQGTPIGCCRRSFNSFRRVRAVTIAASAARQCRQLVASVGLKLSQAMRRFGSKVVPYLTSENGVSNLSICANCSVSECGTPAYLEIRYSARHNAG